MTGQRQWGLNRFDAQVNQVNIVSAFRFSLRQIFVLGAICCMLLVTGCSLPQVSAESRLFLNLSLEYLDQYPLAQTEVQPPTTDRFSALTYDRSLNRFYVLGGSPPNLYTLKFSLPVLTEAGSSVAVAVPEIESTTRLTASEAGFELGKGVALTPRSTVFIVGEMESSRSSPIPPRLSEFQLASGQQLQTLPLPKQYGSQLEESRLGIQPHQGLKALAINEEGDRLFTATQAPLNQDLQSQDVQTVALLLSSHYSRLLHYWISEPEPLLISEHLYPLESSTESRCESELIDIVPFDSAGHFLSLEQSHDLSNASTTGYHTTLYQFVTGVATDTSQIRTLPPSLAGIAPILKRPLLDLEGLPGSLHMAGMTLGPYFPDGSRSLVILRNRGSESSDTAQLLVLRLVKAKASVQS